MNENLKNQDAANLKTMSDQVKITDTFYQQGDYLSINSVRINDMFYADG